MLASCQVSSLVPPASLYLMSRSCLVLRMTALTMSKRLAHQLLSVCHPNKGGVLNCLLSHCVPAVRMWCLRCLHASLQEIAPACYSRSLALLVPCTMCTLDVRMGVCLLRGRKWAAVLLHLPPTCRHAKPPAVHTSTCLLTCELRVAFARVAALYWSDLI